MDSNHFLIINAKTREIVAIKKHDNLEEAKVINKPHVVAVLKMEDIGAIMVLGQSLLFDALMS